MMINTQNTGVDQHVVICMLSDILFWTVDQRAVMIPLINSVGGCDDHLNFWRTRITWYFKLADASIQQIWRNIYWGRHSMYSPKSRNAVNVTFSNFSFNLLSSLGSKIRLLFLALLPAIKNKQKLATWVRVPSLGIFVLGILKKKLMQISYQAIDRCICLNIVM